MTHAELQRQIGQDLNGVLEVPRAEKTPPPQFGVIRDHLKTGHGPLQESGQARESRLSQLARRCVFVILYPLKPDSRADLMTSLADLHAVCICEQVSAIPDIGGV